MFTPVANYIINVFVILYNSFSTYAKLSVSRVKKY